VPVRLKVPNYWFWIMSAHEWASRRLEQICLSVPPAYRAAPLASRTTVGGDIAAVVLDHGRAIGMVMVSNLQQAAAAGAAGQRREVTRREAGSSICLSVMDDGG
jgi:hypothetical protein